MLACTINCVLAHKINNKVKICAHTKHTLRTPEFAQKFVFMILLTLYQI